MAYDILETRIFDSSEELVESYQKLYLNLSMDTQKACARDVIESARNGFKTIPVTNDTLITSLGLLDIDLDDPNNIDILIHLLNNDPSFRNGLFDLNPGKADTSFRPKLGLNKVSKDLLEHLLGNADYNNYILNKTAWLKIKENSNKLDAALKKINDSIINRSQIKLLKSLKQKLQNNFDFAYNLFIRWDIPDYLEPQFADKLKEIALQNPGAALGILINPKLKKLLVPKLSESDKKDLQDKAKIISSSPIKLKNQQHYETLTILLLKNDEENNAIYTGINSILSAFLSSDDIETSLQAGIAAINICLLNPEVDINSHIGTIISLFADKFHHNSDRDSALSKLIDRLMPNINTVIEGYARGKNHTKITPRKHQVDLLLSKPEISNKLDLSNPLLATLAGAEDPQHWATEIKTNKNNLKKYISDNYIKKNGQIPEGIAFIIANKPALWEQFDPAKRHPIKSKLNEWFGWYKDDLKKAKNKLANQSQIFKRKLNGETAKNQLKFIPIPGKDLGSPIFPPTPGKGQLSKVIKRGKEFSFDSPNRDQLPKDTKRGQQRSFESPIQSQPPMNTKRGQKFIFDSPNRNQLPKDTKRGQQRSFESPIQSQPPMNTKRGQKMSFESPVPKERRQDNLRGRKMERDNTSPGGRSRSVDSIFVKYEQEPTNTTRSQIPSSFFGKASRLDFNDMESDTDSQDDTQALTSNNPNIQTSFRRLTPSNSDIESI